MMVPLSRGSIILTGSTSSLIGREDHLILAAAMGASALPPACAGGTGHPVKR